MPDQSMHFGSFLKQFDHALYDEYALERYKNDINKYKAHKAAEPDFRVSVEERLKAAESLPENNAEFLKGLRQITELPVEHPAVQYVVGRRIPSEHLGLLYYAPRFYRWATTNTDRFKITPKTVDHPRLIIPWYDASGKVFAYQGRAFGPETPKYYTIVLDDTKPHFYGMERIDSDKKIYVVEGPIDSLFLPNSVAVGSSALMNFKMSGSVYVFDNEPRNKDIVKIIEKAVFSGADVFVPPTGYTHKDINEAIEAGMTSEQIVAIIDDNTHNSIEAQMKFSNWKKC
jgi:hypothetical protein